MPRKKKTQKEPTSPRRDLVAYYSGVLGGVEQATKMVSNEAKYCDPMSFGVLCLDWAMHGGVPNVMASVSGAEQAGKTTAVNHLIANSIKSESLFTLFIDAEGTLNPEYASSIFRPYGINMGDLLDSDEKLKNPFRYYNESVIETAFDLMHSLLRQMPTKFWIADENTWAYAFPKRNKTAAKAMEVYGCKPSRSLSTQTEFVCPTDFAGVEASIFIDSFAAMVSRDDDEADQKSRQLAVEAKAFSMNLKRIVSRLSSKGVALVGTNQLRKIPMARYGPDSYEPGGEALNFYTAQRGRLVTRVSGFPGLEASRDKETGHFVEPSVHNPSTLDHYSYKAFTNTKNKMGSPNKKTWVRVWISDYMGKSHGIDPYFDVFHHMLTTGQLKKNKRKLKFSVAPSLGSKKKVQLLNSLPPFTEMQLKALVLGEFFNDRKLLKSASADMKLTSVVNLRKSLFEQMRKDPQILKLSPSQTPDDVDYEDGADEL